MADIGRRLIDICADIIEAFGGKMITRKKKEDIPMIEPNMYLSKELGRADLYSEKPICNKIDTVVKKGKRIYITNRKEKRAGNALKKTLN